MADLNYIQTVRSSVQSSYRFLLRIDEIPFAMIASVDRPSPNFGSPREFQLLNWKFKIVESFDNEKFDSVAGILLNTYKRFGYDNPNQVQQSAPLVKDMSKRSLINSIGTVKIETLTPDGDVYETWELYNAFVTGIRFDSHRYSGNQILGASVTLAYDWAEMTYTAASGRETTY